MVCVFELVFVMARFLPSALRVVVFVLGIFYVNYFTFSGFRRLSVDRWSGRRRGNKFSTRFTRTAVERAV